MSKKSRFRGCIVKQDDKRAETLLKSAWQHLYKIHWSLIRDLCSKKSLLLKCQILGLLVNTLATDEKYPVLNRDNLTIPIQMILSEKRKSRSQYFHAFLKSRWNSGHFETKFDPHRFCISNNTDSENVVREISKKSRFRGPFEKQYCNRAQALLKSTSQHLCHIQRSLPRKLNGKKVSLIDMQNLGISC